MEELFNQIGVWLETVGPWAYLVAPALMAGVAILPIPAEFPAMINGAIFGPWIGSLITYAGALTGAQASFELSRRLGRPVAERFVGAEALQRCDEVVDKAGWWGMLVPRFIPMIAFTALNWCAGLTAVSRWRFFWTTAVGIVPGVVVFTVSGVGLATLARRYPVAVIAVLGIITLLFVAHRRRQRRASLDADPTNA